MQGPAHRLSLFVGASLAVAAALPMAARAQQEPPRAPGVQTPGVEQRVLVDAPLAQFPGKRVLVFTGEFEPGAKTPLHRHPGTELLYVLEGSGTMVLAGRESRELEPGTMLLVEPRPGEDAFIHQAINLSGAEGMKTLVIVIHDEGTPPALPVTDENE